MEDSKPACETGKSSDVKSSFVCGDEKESRMGRAEEKDLWIGKTFPIDWLTASFFQTRNSHISTPTVGLFREVLHAV